MSDFFAALRIEILKLRHSLPDKNKCIDTTKLYIARNDQSITERIFGDGFLVGKL